MNKGAVIAPFASDPDGALRLHSSIWSVWVCICSMTGALPCLWGKPPSIHTHVKGGDSTPPAHET